MLQGVELNGINFNSMRLNGPVLQGQQYNGFRWNGPVIQGAKFNGLRLNSSGDTGVGGENAGLNGRVIAIEF